ncbi:MAG: hypothetical protein ACM3P1_11080 [Candidatus Saccharibacteria bacterium]
MGENKINQQVGKSDQTDKQQTYGSQQQGRHNREGASSMDHEANEEETNHPSMEQPNRMNPQDQQSDDDSYDYEKDDEQFDQGRFTMRSQLNEMQDDNMIARVEGDDKDILGETENSRRNQQNSPGKPNQGNSKER